MENKSLQLFFIMRQENYFFKVSYNQMNGNPE